MAFLSKFRSPFGVHPWIKSILKRLSAGLGWAFGLVRRFPRLSLFALGALYFGLVLALSVWFFLKQEIKGQVVTVPDLFKVERAVAEERIRAVGLVPVIVAEAERYSPTVPKDAVLSQLPRAGRMVKVGRVVEISLSAGVELKKIPDLTGNGLAFAESLARQAETRIAKRSSIPSARFGTGQVIAQHPAPGEELGLANGISLLISSGPPETYYVMPRLVGLDFAKVKLFLDKKNLRHVVKFRVSSEFADATVIEQSPRAGDPLSSAQNITLIVAKEI